MPLLEKGQPHAERNDGDKEKVASGEHSSNGRDQPQGPDSCEGEDSRRSSKANTEDDTGSHLRTAEKSK